MLDELIGDNKQIFLHSGDPTQMPVAMSGKDLKAAIRAEIAAQVKAMREGLCGVKDHHWEYNYDYKRCTDCGETVSS